MYPSNTDRAGWPRELPARSHTTPQRFTFQFNIVTSPPIPKPKNSRFFFGGGQAGAFGLGWRGGCRLDEDVQHVVIEAVEAPGASGHHDDPLEQGVAAEDLQSRLGAGADRFEFALATAHRTGVVQALEHLPLTAGDDADFVEDVDRDAMVGVGLELLASQGIEAGEELWPSFNRLSGEVRFDFGNPLNFGPFDEGLGLVALWSKIVDEVLREGQSIGPAVGRAELDSEDGEQGSGLPIEEWTLCEQLEAGVPAAPEDEVEGLGEEAQELSTERFLHPDVAERVWTAGVLLGDFGGLFAHGLTGEGSSVTIIVLPSGLCAITMRFTWETASMGGESGVGVEGWGGGSSGFRSPPLSRSD